MYFCPNCDTVFDITRLSEQKGGTQSDSIDTPDQVVKSSRKEKIAQHAGAKVNYEDLINKILDDSDISSDEIKGLSFEDLLKSNYYKKLKVKDKEFVFNKIQDILPVDEKQILNEEQVKSQGDKAYFKCKNCGYLKPIQDGTLIFSRVSSDIAQSYATSDFKDMVYSDILPRTRKYICPNDKCESHDDPIKREAVFFRMNNTFRIKYICVTCKTAF